MARQLDYVDVVTIDLLLFSESNKVTASLNTVAESLGQSVVLGTICLGHGDAVADLCAAADGLMRASAFMWQFDASQGSIRDSLARSADTLCGHLGIQPSHWLHIGSDALLTLAARGIGATTSMFKTGKGATKNDVGAPTKKGSVAAAPGIAFPDAYALLDAIHEANGRPVRYQVQVTTSADKTASEFVEWMRREHGAALLEQHGCREFRVLVLGQRSVRCEYVFANKRRLDEYLAGPADEIRRRSADAFPDPAACQFTRDHAELAFAQARCSPL